METYKIGLAQIHSLLGDVEGNLAKHLKYIERAKEMKVDILAFPELSLTGYLLKDLAYELSDRCLGALREIERASKGMTVLVGVVEEPRYGIYRNSIAVVQDGKVAGFVPKLYLPNYGLFEESRYFKEGDVKDVRVFEHQGLKFGVVICEDAWHPEPIELLARLGADLIFVNSSSPLRGLYGKGETFVERVWEAINVTRAVENTVYIAFVNRVGVEDEECFWGGSMLVSPEGEILLKARKMEEELMVVDISTHVIRRARRFSSFKEHRRDIHEVLGDLP